MVWVLERINTFTPDQDFQSFLDAAWGFDPTAKRLAKQFVEGFHAAPADRISLHALAAAEEASEREEGTRQFHLAKGYSALARWYVEQIQAAGGVVEMNTIVRRVNWAPGRVSVLARCVAGERTYAAQAVIVTLPLGVLKQKEAAGAVRFDPALPASHSAAIQSLEVGSVMKIGLQFRSAFWSRKHVGFFHAPDSLLGTWWTDTRGPVITGWAGGPNADRLLGMSSEALTAEAIRTVAGLFSVPAKQVGELLQAAHTYDWRADPFTRGAYSYTPVRMTRMARHLAAPVADTLFFAGEATNDEGDQGTVHGALTTGLRAARDIIECWAKPVAPAREVQSHA